MMSRFPSVYFRALTGLGFLLVACGSDAEDGGGSSAGAGSAGVGGVNAGGSSGTGANGAGASGGAGANSGGAGASSGGVSGGAGGSSGGAGAAGAAGSSAGGSGSLAGTSGGGGSAGGASGTGGAAGGAGVACPADSTFCSGFEDAALPAGAVYKVNAAPGEWTRDFAIDTTVFRGGKSALRVKSSSEAGVSGSSYQMLAVPAPLAKFWVRFYVRQADLDLGGVEHNVFAGAADSDEPNSNVMVELAEDVGLAFNSKDAVRWPTGYGRITGKEMPYTLPKASWHCIEISYDSATRTQKLFVNGSAQIDATDYPTAVDAAFKFFKFGFNKLHGPARAVWYDDVAVGPTRAGCF